MNTFCIYLYYNKELLIFASHKLFFLLFLKRLITDNNEFFNILAGTRRGAFLRSLRIISQKRYPQKILN